MDSAFANETVINLGHLDRKPGFFSIFITLFSLLLLISLASFGAGFLYGQVKSNEPSEAVSDKVTKVTTQTDGSKIFTDSTHGYQISFGSDFNLTEIKDGVGHIRLETKESYVELWLTVDQPLAFSSEQKAAITDTSSKTLDIDNEKADLTENLFEAGNYFSIVKLSASETHPQATFWVKGLDKTSYDSALKVVQSFKFNQ